MTSSDPTPVAQWRIAAAADFGINNADAAATACRTAGLPYWAACALLEKESAGHNVFGHDDGGALSGYPHPVTREGYRIFRWMVVEHGYRSNGVGPCQITWAGTLLPDGTRDGGYFAAMEQRGLRPWAPIDNMVFGFGLLAMAESVTGSWVLAGERYNGKRTYGEDLLVKVKEWHSRLRIRGPLPSV